MGFSEEIKKINKGQQWLKAETGRRGISGVK